LGFNPPHTQRFQGEIFDTTGLAPRLFIAYVMVYPLISLRPRATGGQPRYPREMLITEQDMKAAIENAKVVYAFVQIQCAPGLPITG
jgi:hypothetical protein